MADPLDNPSTSPTTPPNRDADSGRTALGAADASSPGTSADDLSDSLPSAGAEVETQVASATGASAATTARSTRDTDDLLPSPSAYDMPDEYADGWLDRTKTWVEEHPALAVLAAAGIGIAVGRLLMASVPEPEPQSLVERVERRAKGYQKDARRAMKSAKRGAGHLAEDTGEALQERLHQAAEALSSVAEAVTGRAEAGVERTKDLADVLSDAVRAAVTGVVAKKADSWTDRFRR